MSLGQWNLAIVRHRHRRHGWALRLLVVVHVIAIWVVGMAIHPGWLLGLGLLAAVGLAIILADSDARDGVQEMMASLPMRRWRQLLITWLYGFIPLAMVTVIGGLAYAWELHQALWQPLGWTIFTTSPGPGDGLFTLAQLAVWGPLMVYTSIFGITALFAQRSRSVGAALVATLGLGLLAGAALWLEYHRGLPVQGRFILMFWGLNTALVVALSVYRCQQGDPVPGGALLERRGGRGGLNWRVVLVVLILLIILWILFVAVNFSVGYGMISEQPMPTSSIPLQSIPSTPPEAP